MDPSASSELDAMAVDNSNNNNGGVVAAAAAVGEDSGEPASVAVAVPAMTTTTEGSRSAGLKRKRENTDAASKKEDNGGDAPDKNGGGGGTDILSQINTQEDATNGNGSTTNDTTTTTKDNNTDSDKPSLQTLAESALEQERKENEEKAAAAVAAAAVGVGIIDAAAQESLLAAAAPPPPEKKTRRRSRPIKSFDDPDKQDRLEDYRRKKRERQKRYRQEEKDREAKLKAAGLPVEPKHKKKKAAIDPNQPIVGDEAEGEDGDVTTTTTTAATNQANAATTEDWRTALRVPTLAEDAASAEPKGYRMSEEDTNTWNTYFIPLTVSTIEQPPLVKKKKPAGVAAESGEAAAGDIKPPPAGDEPAVKMEDGTAAAASATEPEEETLIDINFAATIGCVDGKKMRWVKNQSKIYLPPQYNQNSREYRAKVIGPLFAAACSKTGSKVMMYGWEPLKGNAKFGCYRSRTQQYKSASHHKAPAAPNSLAPESMTRKPATHDELCRFSFHVYWDEDVERWYIKRFGAGCKCHINHPRMDPFEASQKGQEPTGDEIRTLHMERGPYSISHPLFSEIASSIKEPDDSIHFRRLLLDFKEYLQQKLMIQKQQEQQEAGEAKKKKEKNKKPAPEEEEDDDEEDAEISDSSDDEDANAPKGATTHTTPTGTKLYRI